MGFEEEIGGRSRGRNWRRERMNGGVAAEIGGEREGERCEREWREESRRRRWVLRERLEVRVK
ncbi:hypothetical protein TIFTF001_045598 [Ficus carica]|uniref:Uncharacterized protein n=1 Tax=Ficus carica TaxID=3494 RepID=A0AA87Z9U0_FICCA|nr:hypothetical protein TIFTF001_045598 [Ficus carica]